MIFVLFAIIIGMNYQKMMKQMEKMQEELGEKRINATSGGGAVSVTVNGLHELVEVKIDPAAVDPEDVTMLEDLILTAANEALRKAQEVANSQLGKITGGLSIPGLKL